jgi:cytochrome c-type biogenesis protein CcmH/NrfG
MMSARDVFWLCVGLLAAAAIAFVLPPFVRALPVDRSKAFRTGAIAAFSSLFLLVSVGLYQLLGEPRAIDGKAAAVASSPHGTAMQRHPAGAGESLQAATDRLAERLGRDGGSDADWELLAQSYEYAGDAASASSARQHKLASKAQPTRSAAVADDTDLYRKRVADNPKDDAAWLAIAQIERTARNFPAARKAFDQAITLNAMSADDWADYADVLGSIDGKLGTASGKALDKALALDPKHPKALWLSASLALEQGRHADALKQWQRLRELVADSSPDATIIDANIEEARSLVAGKSAVAASAAPPHSAAIRGTVDIDPALKSQLRAGMTLFVFAKSVDSPGPPLAVLTTRPEAWPVTFVLDDSLAMLPQRRLSSFDKVLVEARLTSSGQATAQAGDLQAVGSVVRTSANQSLALRISRIIS